LLSAGLASTGRPAKDRAALATAFVAKAIVNLPTKRDLIDRLKVDRALHQFGGWRGPLAIPHEFKFSRAFAEFAASELTQQLYAAMIETPASDRPHRARLDCHPGTGTCPGRLMGQKRAAQKEKKVKRRKPRRPKGGRRQGDGAPDVRSAGADGGSVDANTDNRVINLKLSGPTNWSDKDLTGGSSGGVPFVRAKTALLAANQTRNGENHQIANKKPSSTIRLACQSDRPLTQTPGPLHAIS
jgi:hypothetical protein